MMANQFIRQNVQNHKKYRPQRASAGNQQIRISRPFSQGSDTDQNSKSVFILVLRCFFFNTKQLDSLMILEHQTKAFFLHCFKLLILY